MIEFSTNLHQYRNDLEDIVRLFFPSYGLGFGEDFVLKIEHNSFTQNSKIDIKIIVENQIVFDCQIDDFCHQNKLLYKRLFIRAQKNALYKALEGTLKRSLPWGSLTGIRPTKPAMELYSELKSHDLTQKAMQENYFLSPQKSQLLMRVLRAQEGFFPKKNERKKLVNLYINIPFCPTRCAYCSFISMEISRAKKVLDEYVNSLIWEIEATQKMLSELNLKVYTTYIGGGTPTSLSHEQLSRVLNAVNNFGCEFTLEAGRADSITEQKLIAAKNSGVGRICVNCQTLNDKTLNLIGRNHTAQEFFEAYKLCADMGFDVNVDLIAGLNGETLSDFKHSLDGTIELLPQNITVHTLSYKSGAKIKEQKQNALDVALIGQMVEYSQQELLDHGYLPYYLYRQKYMLGNHENTGWALKHKQCRNNISVMEEMVSVVGCGAGAISKAIYADGGRIERYANTKDIALYLQRLQEIMQKKKNLLQNSLLF